MKKVNKKRLGIKLLIVLLAVVLVLMISGVAAVEYVLGKIGSAVDDETFPTIPPELEDFETDPPPETTEPTTEPSDTNPTETEPEETTQAATEEATPPTTAPQIEWPVLEEFKDDQIINVLLIGQDMDAASGIGRSDTMILVSLNKRTNAICMTSIMRDLYVQIPGYSDNRVNAAYRFGGVPLLKATLKKNFGLNIDGSVVVGFDQFQKIIDILGGVDISLTAAEAAHMQSLGFSYIQAGSNHLDGYQSLVFCRIRKIDSDHNRTERQRRVLTALAGKAKSIGVGNALAFVNQILPYVKTDLSDAQIVSYATTGLSMLTGGGGLKSGKVPQNGDYTSQYIRGMLVMVPNLWRCHDYIGSFIYGK